MNDQAGMTATEAKRKNIIEMALSFTAMTRVFSKDAMKTIAGKLETLFASLDRISTCDDYEKTHSEFCKWFRKRISLAKSKGTPIIRPSYGQAAKVLDVAAKVYVYYCALPNPVVADRIVPMLHAAIDTAMMLYLAKQGREFGIRSKSIQQVNCEEYNSLQSAASQDAKDQFGVQMLPVQYDDIMWRRLKYERKKSNGATRRRMSA